MDNQNLIHKISYIRYTLHELPSGVLYGSNGATDKECDELITETYSIQNSFELNSEQLKYLELARWYYERYKHYLGRNRHFDDFSAYLKIHRPLMK